MEKIYSLAFQLKDIYLCLMLRITLHIEQLLLEQDYVLVPGVGGFVSQVVNSAYHAEDDMFLPMQKEVAFNATLQYNDGLLLESYMRTYSVDYHEAWRMLEGDVDELRAKLCSDGEVSLGYLGAFRVGSEGQTVFLPNTSRAYSAYAYGLAPFKLSKLATLEAERRPVQVEKEEQQHKDVLYIPVSRRWIRVAVASVAAILIFLMLSTPVKEVNQSAYKASFIPSEIVSHPSETISSELTTDSRPETKTDALQPEAVTPNVAKSQTLQPAHPTGTAALDKKMYHIIIASFPTREQAENYMKGVDKSTFANADIVVRNGKFRIYAERFDNRPDAEDYLQSIRENAKYKDAWLFISR